MYFYGIFTYIHYNFELYIIEASHEVFQHVKCIIHEIVG